MRKVVIVSNVKAREVRINGRSVQFSRYNMLPVDIDLGFPWFFIRNNNV
jgi:hypothetical protein